MGGMVERKGERKKQMRERQRDGERESRVQVNGWGL